MEEFIQWLQEGNHWYRICEADPYDKHYLTKVYDLETVVDEFLGEYNGQVE